MREVVQAEAPAGPVMGPFVENEVGFGLFGEGAGAGQGGVGVAGGDPEVGELGGDGGGGTGAEDAVAGEEFGVGDGGVDGQFTAHGEAGNGAVPGPGAMRYLASRVGMSSLARYWVKRGALAGGVGLAGS